MQLSFRNAVDEDIDVIFSLSKQLIDQYEDVQKINYDRVINWVKNKINTRINEYTVIIYNNEKAGYVRICDDTENGMTEIDDLYVLPEFRNKGIGTEVLKKIISEASLPLYFYVFVKNYRAINLYFRMGFEISKVVHDTRYIMKYKTKK